MRYTYLFLGCVCVLALAAVPAQALTIDTLAVSLDTNGGAQVGIVYELTLAEQAAVFFHIADPAQELERALSENLGRPVTVQDADYTSADVTIPSFASVVTVDGSRTIVMPAFSLENAQQAMERYWFAPLASPDFSPETTTVIFPDGYSRTFSNLISFPSITHTLGSA